MVRPIVRDFICKWPLRMGCMIIAILGMIIAGITLLTFVMYISFLGKLNDKQKPELYFMLFMFLTAYQVLDFTIHLLLYFASKKGDLNVMKIIWIYLAIKFLLDIVFTILILTLYTKMLVVAIIILTFYGFRIYFFIVVYSSYAILLERKISRDLFRDVSLNEKRSSTPIYFTSNRVSPEEIDLKTSDSTTGMAPFLSALKKDSGSSAGSKKSVTIMVPNNKNENRTTARSSSPYIDSQNKPHPNAKK